MPSRWATSWGPVHWPSYLPTPSWQDVLIFLCMIRLFLRPFTAVDSEMFCKKTQKPTSGHCSCRGLLQSPLFFFQNSGGHELKGLVPWPFQPCQISARWGDSPTKGTPFSLKVFVSKEVATEEFAKTLKVCFLWLFVLTGVCWTKLEFWVQEGTHFCGFRCVNPISSYPRRSDRTLATNPFEAWWCVSCVFG